MIKAEESIDSSQFDQKTQKLLKYLKIKKIVNEKKFKDLYGFEPVDEVEQKMNELAL